MTFRVTVLQLPFYELVSQAQKFPDRILSGTRLTHTRVIAVNTKVSQKQDPDDKSCWTRVALREILCSCFRVATVAVVLVVVLIASLRRATCFPLEKIVCKTED